jgi:UDP-glucose:(heptosyl)LPS alpha-1,3-glucosyltransferase
LRIALVHIRQSETGGTERYMNQIAAHLVGGGHRVTIVCRRHERPPHPAVRFEVLRSPAIGAAWRMWAFAHDVERHVKAAGYDLVFALGRTWTHEVIRVGGGCHQTYLEAMHASRWRRMLTGMRLKHRVTLAIERRALHPSAYRRVITNSVMVKDDIVRRYRVPEERVTVVYNGVDLERFHPTRWRGEAAELRRSCGFASGDVVLLFLGTGYRRKGLDLVLAAFAELARAHDRLRLLVVGYDSARAAYERQASRMGILSQTRFLGGRRDAEVCFAAADLYVLPTLYDPFANSTLEALATGLPVITTRSNGGGEVLTHRADGSILRTCAVPSLVEELRFWIDRARSPEGGAAARATAEHYSEDRAMQASVAILQQCLGE